MPTPGQIAFVRLQNTDLTKGKNRPVLILGKCPGKFDDWLVCPVSSQQHQAAPGIDELINSSDADFGASGLKLPSVIRVCRLAVVDGAEMAGAIGCVDLARMNRILTSLKNWVNKL